MCKSKFPYAFSIIIALLVGALSGLFVTGNMATYYRLAKPDITPPMYIFSLVWTILYVLMGVSSAMIFCSRNENSKKTLKIYALQLLINFFWGMLFFVLEMRFVAFLWILLLIAVVAIMIVEFGEISKAAARLQFPYLFWLFFAAYLNYSIWMLNR